MIYPIYKFDILNREIDTPPKLKQNFKEEDYFKKYSEMKLDESELTKLTSVAGNQ